MFPYSRIEITRISNQDCFRIRTEKTTVIVDPGFLGSLEDQHFTAEVLTKADLILVSHAHFDHLNPQLLELLVHKETIICGPKSCLGKTSLPLTVVKAGETHRLLDVEVKVVEAYNTPEGHSHPKNHHPGDSVGYVFRINGKTFYFAGDTDLIDEMKDLGPIDVAMLPIGGTYVMDAGEAVEAAKRIKPNLVLAMHQMTSDPTIFKALIHSVNIPMVFLKPGESITL